MVQTRFARVLLTAILLLISNTPVFGACAGGAGCARSDRLTLAVTGVGSSAGSLSGFTDAAYQWSAANSCPTLRTSCQQPGALQTSAFEFVGDLPGLGPARLYLDPNRKSGGKVVPMVLPQSAAAIDPDGGLFPAVNEMTFYLRLDVPDLGLHLASVQPVTVRAVIGEWPPPPGTNYVLQKRVQFAERDSVTGAPTGPVLAKLEVGSQAYFHPAGPIETTLEQTSVQGNSVSLSARLATQTADSLRVVWHLYSREKIVSLGQPSASTPEYGPRAGRADLQPGVPQLIDLPAQMTKPGSEFVTLFAAAESGGQIFGGRQDLRVVLPDNGLMISEIAPTTVKGGSSQTLVLTGDGFELPLSLSVSEAGIDVGKLTLVSPQEVRAEVVFRDAVYPGPIDVTLTSNGRVFTFVDALTVLWPRPVIQRIEPVVQPAGVKSLLRIHGDFFLAPSFVSLGPNVQVVSVRRVRRDLLSVTILAPTGFTGTADVIVVGANGSAAQAGAVTIVP